jgi:hypothetical protein
VYYVQAQSDVFTLAETQLGAADEACARVINNPALAQEIGQLLGHRVLKSQAFVVHRSTSEVVARSGGARSREVDGSYRKEDHAEPLDEPSMAAVLEDIKDGNYGPGSLDFVMATGSASCRTCGETTVTNVRVACEEIPAIATFTHFAGHVYTGAATDAETARAALGCPTSPPGKLVCASVIVAPPSLGKLRQGEALQGGAPQELHRREQELKKSYKYDVMHTARKQAKEARGALQEGEELSQAHQEELDAEAAAREKAGKTLSANFQQGQLLDAAGGETSSAKEEKALKVGAGAGGAA